MAIKVIVVGGASGCGKSTLIRRMASSLGGSWVPRRAGALQYVHNESSMVRVLGVYDRRDSYPGTDRLSRSIRPLMLHTLSQWAARGDLDRLSVVLEGVWLFYQSFVSGLLEINGVSSHFIIMESSPKVVHARKQGRRDRFDDRMLRTQRSHATRLSRISFPAGTPLRWRNDSPKDMEECISKLRGLLEVRL